MCRNLYIFHLDYILFLFQPLWRLINDTKDKRMLVYKSEDIRNVSRLHSSKVCGYVRAEEEDWLPAGLVDGAAPDGETGGDLR